MPDRINIRIRLEAGALWATVEEFPGVFATGETPDELRRSLEEGVALYAAESGEEACAVRVSPFEAVADVQLAFE